MLIPGTADWADAVPAVLLALAVLGLPGVVGLLLLGTRPLLALACGPAVSTVLVVVGGSVAALVDVPWGLVPLAVTTLAAWLVAGLLRLALRRLDAGPDPLRETPRSAVGDSSADGGEDDDRQETQPTRPSRVARLLPHVALAGGVLVAFAVVARVLTASALTPEEFPQHPDTIFHLGVTQWMAANADVSFQHGTTFIDRPLNLSYPVGFHAVAATVSLLSGASAVVSISALVLVVTGLAWPVGMAALARATFAPSVAAAPVAAVTSVLFIAFPFMLMGFGVLWPNLFGQVMLAGTLAAAVVLTRGLGGDAVGRREVGVLLVTVLVAAPGLGLAHPSALVVLILLGGLAVWFATLRRALDGTTRSARWWPFLTVTVAIVVGTLLSVILAPTSMLGSGDVGPEMSWQQAWDDTLGFAPRVADPAPLLGWLVGAGVLAVLVWRRRALWAAVAAPAFAGLYLVATAVDTESWRFLTWPWYNNAIRIAAVGVLPAALVAAAAIAGVARIAGVAKVGGRRRGPVAELLVAGLLVGLVVVPSLGFKDRDVTWLRPYFLPGESRSWASPEELASLRVLARDIPADAVVAADPWKGATYLYVVSGRRLYYPTEKTNTTPERRLVGLGLDRVGTDPEVCRVVRDAGIEYAITGGVPFLWGVEVSARTYTGIEGIASSPAWEVVATEAPYTLYRRVACAE